MTTSLFAIISYVLISTFTPGPSNISSTSMAVIHGYKGTIKYQIGLALGVFLLMMVSGWFSTTLLNVFPSLEPLMRYVGAAYILYLALGLLKATYFFAEENTKPLGLANGFILQILNPKLVVYAFTLFTAFLTHFSTNLLTLIFLSVLLAATSFCATSVWALFGMAIQAYLHNPGAKTIINILLSLSLIYIAMSLILFR
jgi:cysteine/O-acetylserine efflux protein